ncbi:hypothetical protein CJF42_09860 [Pseudoalteromonas sp. NBT06-2]|uniref:SIR2 family protein n=1 Tax=Pseudoalteromonas sp. NBT06-2 TaxID=2025950 RepID=UPI000BA79068|nr:SIR2 family protein [Pseudoalteromonas sp. NBT06-2]PAJ74518.1 hypothetical protein CJF42_09860 [Pseudoalteromonas sp. NBT06-2]
MANAIKIKEEIKPLLDALEKYHDFKSENEILDDDESGFSVYFQKGDDAPVALAKSSLALFHGDPHLYNQESERIRLNRLEEVLNTSQFPRNKQNFNELLKAQRANKITPFIGAGASISAGCMSWRNYLVTKAKEVGIEDSIVNKYLAEYKYEDLLELVTKEPGIGEFEFYFQQDFDHADPELSYVWLLPDVFKACVITTNFDRVIEDCYSSQSLSFTEKEVGLNNPHTFIKAMTRGDHYLLKLHGNIDKPEHRVFTKSEYRVSYSESDQQMVNMDYPLPQLLSRLYRSHSFLFIGCSLITDRTVKTFELIVEQEGANKVADHFAIIEKPESTEEYNALKQKLMVCNIKPIWHDTGDFDKVNEIISLLLI